VPIAVSLESFQTKVIRCWLNYLYYFNITCTSFPRERAILDRKSSDGLYVPLSRRLMLDFWVPTRSANSSWVIFWLVRASMICEMTS